MKKMLNKFIALITVSIIITINLMTDVVYASNAINEDEKKNVENFVFDANINNSKTVSADISQELMLNLNLALKAEGYLKNVKVKLEGNNYVISKTVDEINQSLITDKEITNVNKMVKSIENDEIVLKEVDSNEDVNAIIPIKFNREKLVSAEDLEKDSKVTLTATYVNGVNKDVEITNTVNLHIKWTVKAEVEVSQKLVRYLKYDNKTMVSFEINDGIKDNSIPAKSKEISLTIPQIEGQDPENITVVGDNIQNEKTGRVLKITKSNIQNQDGKYEWNTSDKYTVTYIYGNQTNSTIINSSAIAKITTISEDEVEGKTQEENFEVNAEVGSIVRLEGTAPNEINKGHLYTNLNRGEEKLNTPYDVNYKINVGLAELTDKIIIEEDSPIFNNENGNEILDATNYIQTNKVSVSKDEIINLLGENGKITVRDTQRKEIGILDKNNTELQLNVNKVIIELSKPEKEGNINITTNKIITGSNDFTFQGMLAFKSLLTRANITGYNNELEITKAEIKTVTDLTEPTSKASISVNTETLSTVTGNSDVVFNVVLNKTDISDALYVNPTVKITLPEEITNINLKSARIVYDDELLIEKVEQNGNTLIFNLTGTQTSYNTLTTTQGTLLKIVADLDLNIIAPSNEAKITMEYTNQFTSETKVAETPISIVAPSQMIVTNEISIDDQMAFAMNNEADILKINHGEGAKTMQIRGNVINNTGANAEGFQVIGRIPTAGNKTIKGDDLKSTINSTLKTPIQVLGINNAVVYYSNDINEELNGNGWSLQATSDSKSYKIVVESGLEYKSLIQFIYTVTIPENLDYEQSAKENYGVYYNSNTEKGITQNLIESKVLGIDTGIAPSIRIGVSAIDTNEKYAIDDGGSVQEGQYISYRIKVTNTGSQTANDVAIAAALPDGITLVMPEQEGENNTMRYYNESSSKLLVQNIGTLNGGASTTYEFTAKVEDTLSEDEKSEGKNLTVFFTLAADILGEEYRTASYTVKNTPGYFGLKLSSDVVGFLEPNKEINYLLTLKNANNDNKTNTKVTVNLPKGIKYKGTDSVFENNVKYNEKNNTLTYNLGTVNGEETLNINIKAESNDYETEIIKTDANVTCDGLDGEIKSNEVNFVTLAPNNILKVTQTSNSISSITDEDEIEIYTDITNNGLTDKVIQYNDQIQQELGVIDYKITIDGELVDIGQTNYIDKLLTIPANKTVRITVKAKAYPIEKGTSIKFENKPKIVASNGDEIDVNSLSFDINGTANKLTKDTAQDGQGEKENSGVDQVKEGYKIAGKAWYDENKNGSYDIQEQIFKDMTVKLYDATANQILKNENGEEVSTTTNEYGEYIFENVKPGNYLIISLYDSEAYEVGEYKADKIEESLNSDFVRAILDNKDIAATDVITIKNESLYNIDLGLIKKDQFNLTIDQTVNKVMVASSKGTRQVDFDNDKAEVELTKDELNNSTLLVEYNIKVTNNGDVAGYAKTLVDYIPNGMNFNSMMNPDWYEGKDGYLYTVTLANEVINPGESKDIKLVLTKKINGNGIGITRGRTEIKTTYNERGLKEISALSSNYANSEGNIATSDMIILKKSNVKTISVILVTLAVMALLVFAGYEIKKRYIDKLYNIDNLEQ